MICNLRVKYQFREQFIRKIPDISGLSINVNNASVAKKRQHLLLF